MDMNFIYCCFRLTETLLILANHLPHPAYRSPVSLRETSSMANMSSDLKFYMTVYGSLTAANTLFTAARAFLFAYGGICAATVIHDRLLDRILKVTHQQQFICVSHTVCLYYRCELEIVTGWLIH